MEDALALARKSQSKVGESLALINLADIKLRRKEFGDALDLSRAVARACHRVQRRRLDRHQQGEHRIRAVRPRPRERRQALRRRGARRVRAHRRHRRDRVAARRIRPLSREGRRLQDGARVLSPRAQALRGDGGAPRTSGRCSSCRKSTSRTRGGARSSSSTGRTRSTRRSSRTRRCASASGGCSRRSSRSSLLVIGVLLPQASRQQRPPRAEEPGAQRAQQPRSADRALQPPLFPGFHARRARARRAPAPRRAGHGRSTRCC